MQTKLQAEQNDERKETTTYTDPCSSVNLFYEK